MTEKKYRIRGRAVRTGKTWVGTGLFTKKEAELAVEQMNAKNAGISIHWIEEVEEVESGSGSE